MITDLMSQKRGLNRLSNSAETKDMVQYISQPHHIFICEKNTFVFKLVPGGLHLIIHKPMLFVAPGNEHK